jgi:hypothetical protein
MVVPAEGRAQVGPVRFTQPKKATTVGFAVSDELPPPPTALLIEGDEGADEVGDLIAGKKSAFLNRPIASKGGYLERRTIRGKKGGVRTAKATLARQKSEAEEERTPMQRLVEEEREKNRLVLYTTSTTAIRETYTRCHNIMNIFYNLRVKVVLKDISMSKE